MTKIQKLAVTLPFCVALIAPVTSFAFTPDHDDKRYYDEEHKDYHEWNAGEQRYWREYWDQGHQPYTDWDRANDQQRRDYWRWRHKHHDHDHDHDHDHL